MSKATESKLGALHGAVADHMSDRLGDGDVTAGELAVMVKFLKDNAITVDPELNESLRDMQEALKRRRQNMASTEAREAMAGVAKELLQ